MDRINNNMKIQQQALPAQSAKAAPKKKEAQTPGDSVSLGKAPVGEEKQWLFLNYVGADCNLTKFQLANLDQQEVVGSDANTHMVAIVDVGPNNAPMPLGEGEGTWNGCKTLYLNKDSEVGRLNSEVIADYGAHADTSSPEFLQKSVVDAMKKFPAKNVALIFNDHGGGWTGAMADDTDGDFMSMPGIGKALKGIQEETGKKLDIVGFDACVMAGVEVADELTNAGVNSIMLASQENEGGPGWTYDEMLGEPVYKNSGKSPLGAQVINEAIKETQGSLYKKINVSPREFAKKVVEVNSKHNDDIPTFSATDLTKMDQLKGNCDKLAKAIIDSDDKQGIKDAVGLSENYGGGWAPYRDMRDLHHLTRNIEKKSTDGKLKKIAGEVRKSVEEAVFANQVNPEEHPESKGLHIYMPTQGTLGSDYKELSFAKNTMWDEAIESLGVKHDPTQKQSSKFWPDGHERRSKS
ncbi:MAG: clostripain-related cysteine peptidase [Vulcanimicrobiota bacterium]